MKVYFFYYINDGIKKKKMKGGDLFWIKVKVNVMCV